MERGNVHTEKNVNGLAYYFPCLSTLCLMASLSFKKVCLKLPRRNVVISADLHFRLPFHINFIDDLSLYFQEKACPFNGVEAIFSSVVLLVINIIMENYKLIHTSTVYLLKRTVTGTTPRTKHDLRAELSHPTQACVTKPANSLSLVVLGLSRYTFRICSISMARRITTRNLPLNPSSAFPWPRLIQAQIIGFKK